MRVNIFPSRFAICAVACAAMSGCGSGSHPAPSSPGSPSSPSSPGSSSATFSVASVVPAAGAASVALNSTIQITFSSAANASTVNTTDIKVTDPSPVAGAVSYNSASNTAVFTPAAALAANTTYTVTVSGVTGANGASLASAFTSTFTTVSSTGGGGGGGGAATMQYQVTIFPAYKNPGGGQISIDTKGGVSLQLSGAVASASYTVQFCPAYVLYQQQQPPCISVGNITTDASGNGSATMQFPQAGSWAGDFELMAGTTQAYSTGFDGTAGPDTSTEVYTAALEPESTVNGKGLYASSSTPQGPLTSGSVTYSKGQIVFTMAGASPDTSFETDETPILGGSETYQLYGSNHQSSFTTDANGNLTFSVLPDGMGGDFFEITPVNSSTVGFIGGFTVPK